MNEYIRGLVRAAADSTIQKSKAQSAITHKGMRGRFRELLVENLVSPWLPPYARCGTGMIIDADNRERKATQDDIIVFDQSLMPSVLLSNTSSEGVFPVNAVLARVEVKSVLTRPELRGAIQAAMEIQPMKFAARSDRTWTLPVGLLFAYDSDLQSGADANAELRRFLDVCGELGLLFSKDCPNSPGPIGGLCVVGRGFWGYSPGDNGDLPRWIRAIRKESNPYEEVLMFVGILSNTCFRLHAERQGRDPSVAAEGGIGNFIMSYDTWEAVKL
jgi:hypothetical protein